MEAKRTLTVSELQTVLGVGRSTAYELCNSDGFPSFRIGKKILINAEKLKEWIEKGGTVEND